MDQLRIFFEEYKALLPIGSIIAATLVPVFIAAYAWWRGKFTNWVHVAMYKVELSSGKKTLKIRTVSNISLMDLMMRNIFAAWIIKRATWRATPDAPVLEFSKKNAWRIRNLCRGLVSSLFRDGVLADNLGMPVESGWFIVTMVTEINPNKQDRIGIIIIRENILRNRELIQDNDWQYEGSHHASYAKMLQAVQTDFLKEEEREKSMFKFVRVELSLAKPVL